MTDHKTMCAMLEGIRGKYLITRREAAALIEQQAARIAELESPWRPMSEAPSGVAVLCINAAGDKFTAVKRSSDWSDSPGQWRNPVAWMPVPAYQEPTNGNV